MPQEYLQKQIDEINNLLYKGDEDIDSVLIVTRDIKTLKEQLKNISVRLYRVEREDRKTKNSIIRLLYLVVVLLLYNLAIKFGIKDIINNLLGF